MSTILIIVLLIILLGVAAVSQLYALVFYLPYYHDAMNKLQSAFAFGFLWAVCCLALAYVRNDPLADVEGYMYLLSLPSVLYCGSSAAQQRLHGLASESSATDDIAGCNACIIQLRVRMLLQGVQPPTADNDDDAACGLPGLTPSSANPSLLTRTNSTGSMAGAGMGGSSRNLTAAVAASVGGGKSGGSAAATAAAALQTASMLAGVVKAGAVESSKEERLARARMKLADGVFEAALASPEHSTLLRLFLAHYVQVRWKGVGESNLACNTGVPLSPFLSLTRSLSISLSHTHAHAHTQ